MNPLVSVLMTAFNREKYLPAAIESVLNSTYANFELIISDDGSKDRTVEIAKNYSAKDPRVKVYVNKKNLSDYVNRNKAASYATGKYIKYLDSDDIMYSHCLQVMVDSMEKFSEAGFGLSAKADRLMPYPVSISPQQAYLEHFNNYGHFNRAPGSSIITKSAFDAVGGFTGNRHIGDTELWFTLAQHYHLVKFPPDLYWARDHVDSEGTIEKKADYSEIRKKLTYAFLHSAECPIDPKEIKSSFFLRFKKMINNS